MIISQHTVSWVQICGLIASLYGFFYLSMALFGAGGIAAFRPLLPASASAIAVLALNALWPTPLATTTLDLVGAALGMGIIAYGFAFEEQPRRAPDASSAAVTRRRRIPATVLGFIAGSIILVGTVLLQSANTAMEPRPRTTTALVGLAVAVALTMVLLAISARAPRYLSEQRLQVLGFMLSVLGIASGFLPPLLDVLAVPVR
jgi:hypothetical protein